MMAQVKYHYRMLRLPDDMDWDEFLVAYQDLKWIKNEEKKFNLESQLEVLSKARQRR